MKNILILLVVLLVVPALVLGGLYLFVPDFQNAANDVLKAVPGSIGERFRSMPTSEEIQEQIEQIGAHMLTIDLARAVDKLNLIENEDAKTYDAVIKSMLRMEPNKTEKILAEKRRQSLSANVVLNTIDEISSENSGLAKERADFISKLPGKQGVEELQMMFDNELDPYRLVSSIFAEMSDEDIAKFIPFLSETDVSELFARMTQERQMAIKSLMSAKDVHKTSLTNTALILKGKPIDELVVQLSDTSVYPMEDLVVLFEKLGPKKSGQILSQVEDDTFTFSLVNAIKDAQLLNYGVDNFSEDLLNALNIYKSYDDNINELVNIYLKVDDNKAAEVIKRLYWNTGNVKRYPLNNGEEILISNAQLALDLLRSFPTKKIASVLSYLDNSISTEISTKLAIPNLD